VRGVKTPSKPPVKSLKTTVKKEAEPSPLKTSVEALNSLIASTLKTMTGTAAESKELQQKQDELQE
jgi:hypothetical protein